MGGTSSNVIYSITGDKVPSKSMPLGAFFWGASFVSFFGTEHLFQRMGHKGGFLSGISLSLLSNVIGVVSLLTKTPVLNIAGIFVFGMANHVGIKLPGVAEEHLSKLWAARAVTLMRLGGILAAFAGPETAQAAHGLFIDNKKLEYMEVYLVAGIFNVANFAFISAIRFAPLTDVEQCYTTFLSSGSSMRKSFVSMYKTLMKTRSFLVPMLIAALSWAVMSVPMGLLRFAMKEAGYTSQQTLLTLEIRHMRL